MRQVVKLGEGKFIHLDSYNMPTKGKAIENIIISIFVVGMSTIIAGALAGVDLTKSAPQIAPIIKPVTSY